MNIEDEIADLRRRVCALEESTFRKHRFRRALLDVLQAWPGPFTIQMIDRALRLTCPDLGTPKEYAVAGRIRALEKAGHVAKLNDGHGQNAALYSFISSPPDGRPGRKFNRKADYESGFRAIVRRAVDDLPPEFTLAHIRSWMEAHMPEAQIPYGSWSSTLYKLTQSGELICVKGRGSNWSARRKVWKIGPRRVTPTGDELREVEQAWQEFRKTMDIREIAEQETPLGRGI